MGYVQITRPYGDLNHQPATPYNGQLETLQGVMRLIDAMLAELYGASGITSFGLVTDSTPGSGALTGYAPTGFGTTTGRLDVVSNAADTTLNDLTAGYDGQSLRIRNTGTGTLTLTAENALSTANTRFSGVGDVGIAAGDCLDVMYYAGSVNRWVM